jgi:hypothetical protein
LKEEPKPSSDSEEPSKSKGGKKQGKKGKQGKAGKEAKEEEPEPVSGEEEVKEEFKGDSRMPIEVVYCAGKYYTLNNKACLVCTLPPEYCQHGKKDHSECKTWLKLNHLSLYESIYAEADAAAEELKAGEEGKEGVPQA